MSGTRSILASEAQVDAAIHDIRTALGREPADLLLTDCQLVDVWTERVRPTRIAVRGSRIVAVRPDFAGEARRTIACRGSYVRPGRLELIHGGTAPAGNDALLAKGITSVLLERPTDAERAAWIGSGLRTWIVADGDYKASEPGAGAGTARPVHEYAVCHGAVEAARHLRNGVAVVLVGAEANAVLAALRDAGLDIGRVLVGHGMAPGAPTGALADESPALTINRSTLNPALHFSIDHEVGAVAPGRRADLVLSATPDGTPVAVVANGRLRWTAAPDLFPLDPTDATL